MEIPKSKSLNFLAPSVKISSADFDEVSGQDDEGKTNATEVTDLSITSAMEVVPAQERRLSDSASRLGGNLNPNKSPGHMNLSNTKQYILGTTRVNVRTTGGLPLAKPIPQGMPPQGMPDGASYDPDRVLEGARNALERLENANKDKGSDPEAAASQGNMGMFYRRTTMSPGSHKTGSHV